jgi:hypothetical protein
MNEFDLLARVLSPVYLDKSQHVMKEENASRSFDIEITQRKIRYSVYRFDADMNNFLPFFNNDYRTQDPTKHAPKGLREFCDYVILAEYKDSLYIFLVELKSGCTEGASSQLDASEMFMNYICKSAERISLRNGVDFKEGNIYIKKVIILNGIRPKTNVRDCQPNWKEHIWKLSWEKFPLIKLCLGCLKGL